MSKKKTHSSKPASEIKSVRKYTKFKSLEFWRRNDRGNFVTDIAKLKKFLELNGFRIIHYSGKWLAVKFENNIAKVYSPQEVFNYVLKYIEEQKNDNLTSCFIKEGETLLMIKKAILGSLPEIEATRYKDSKNSAIVFFKNVFVVVDKDNSKSYSYSSLSKIIPNQYILEGQIIKQDFKHRKDFKESQFYEFLKLSTNEKKHFKNVITSIGYMLHRHKNPGLAKVVILSDISSQATNTANGRSGKGIIIKGMEQLLNVVEQNGKNLDLARDKFVYQSIDIETVLFVLQDVQQNFSFEDLFAVITDKMTIERKHQLKEILNFEDSPKIAVTTNYTLSDTGGSFSDRKHLVLLNNHFSSTNKPEKHFGNLFFLEWNDKEYQRFYSFMIYCLQQYFKKGLVEYNSPELSVQKLENETNKTFVELMESDYKELGTYYLLKDIANELREEINNPDDRVRSRVVSGWIQIWANFKGYEVDTRVSAGVAKVAFKKLKN
ncbi:hypothetical protein RBU60_06050 [Mesonia sp. MT50]|uniref:Uncharacterized protein n=1 Tax=Mesonia profundi TaxID=3070998 RepID=A0ABU1A0C0_9FLAO|nr:hypothetical protein [Mesonia profundi]MDQ7917131.1 hypothetical protein [Mesonia profundi]